MCFSGRAKAGGPFEGSLEGGFVKCRRSVWVGEGVEAFQTWGARRLAATEMMPSAPVASRVRLAGSGVGVVDVS